MLDINIREKFPNYYDNVLEIDTLSEAEQQLLSQLRDELYSLINNQWVLTADLSGISRYEKMLNIVPSAEDSEDFRRDRILNRLNQVSPYTITYLVRWLNVYLGEKKYEIEMEYGEYLLTLTVHIGEYGKLDELIKTLTDIVPANIGKVVNNEIICYNFTVRHSGGAVSTGKIYRLSQDIDVNYLLETVRHSGGAVSTGKIYRLSQDIDVNYLLETVRHSGGAVSTASIQHLI